MTPSLVLRDFTHDIRIATENAFMHAWADVRYEVSRKYHHIALRALEHMASPHGNEGNGIPLCPFNPEMIRFTTGGRRILKLFEALQLRIEWQLLQPEDVTERAVVSSLQSNGRATFLKCNATPAARRAIVKTSPHFCATGETGWWVRIKKTGRHPVLIEGWGMKMEEALPPNVRFDPARQIWDVVPN